MSYTFVSYSRRELYFAESLVLQVQAAGFPVWFDLQQLYPGCNWLQELKAGVAGCDRLILVASLAALASPYVEAEWKAALEASKPVYVVLAEAVSLPAELKKAPVIDCRVRFKSRIKRLIALLEGQTVASDQPPRPNPLGVRLMAPIIIWVVLFNLIWGVFSIAALGLVFNALVLRWQSPFMAVLAGMALLWGTWVTVQFWRRKADVQVVRYLSLVAVTLGWLAAVPIFVALYTVRGYIDTPLELIQAGLGLSMVAPLLSLVVAVYGMNWSPNFLRWFAAGHVPQGLRRRVNRRLMRQIARLHPPADEPDYRPKTARLLYTPGEAALADKIKPLLADFELLEGEERPELDIALIDYSDPRPERTALQRVLLGGAFHSGPVTYRLHHAEPDDPIARQIENIFVDYHLVRLTHEADFEIILLSEHLPRATLTELATQYEGRLIGIVVSSIAVPKDIPAVAGYQWVDFRERDGAQLRNLAENIRYYTDPHIGYALETVPTAVQSPRTPARVGVFLAALRTNAAAMLGIGVLGLLPLQAEYDVATWKALLVLVLGAGTFMLANMMIRRWLSFWVVLGLYLFVALTINLLNPSLLIRRVPITYEVRRGDTITEIIDVQCQGKSTVDAVMTDNSLRSEYVRSGQELVLKCQGAPIISIRGLREIVPSIVGNAVLLLYSIVALWRWLPGGVVIAWPGPESLRAPMERHLLLANVLALVLGVAVSLLAFFPT